MEKTAMTEVPMYEHLYGKKVIMDDRFESEHIWSPELAKRNNGRWIPQEVVEDLTTKPNSNERKGTI